MDNERKFLDILEHLGIEMRKTDGGYVLYNFQDNNYPSVYNYTNYLNPETHLEGYEEDVTFQADANGIYHIAYTGNNQDFATLFNATPEERVNKLADLAEDCCLDVDELIGYTTVKRTLELVEQLEDRIDNVYGKDVGDKCKEYSQHKDYSKYEYAVSTYDTSLNNLDDVNMLARHLQKDAETDKDAKTLLGSISCYLDDIQFITGVMKKVDLDRAYAISKGEPVPQLKNNKQPIERD